MSNNVEVDREDLRLLLMHCRDTWSSGDLGFDAVRRCEFALGMKRVWINLFRVPNRVPSDTISPSIAYATYEEAVRHTNNATSYIGTIAVEVPRE